MSHLWAGQMMSMSSVCATHHSWASYWAAATRIVWLDLSLTLPVEPHLLTIWFVQWQHLSVRIRWPSTGFQASLYGFSRLWQDFSAHSLLISHVQLSVLNTSFFSLYLTLQYCHWTSFSVVSCCSSAIEWNHPLFPCRSWIQIWGIWELSRETLEGVPLGGFFFSMAFYTALYILSKAYGNPRSSCSCLIHFHLCLVKLDILLSAAGVGWRGCHIFQKTGIAQQYCYCWGVPAHCLPIALIRKPRRCHTFWWLRRAGSHCSCCECSHCLCSLSLLCLSHSCFCWTSCFFGATPSLKL